MTDRSAVLSIVQISDAHLRREADGQLLGMNTRHSLSEVLKLVREHARHPDMVLASGDIAQDGSPEAYAAFVRLLDGLEDSLYWFAGNHDIPEVMNETLGPVCGGQGAPCVVDCDPWRIILLDSSLQGQVHGELGAGQLAFLGEALETSDRRHVMIAFHHHPIDIRSRWLDTIGLKDRDAFFDLVDDFDNVRLILWGHIHQEWDSNRNGVRLLASPSTCVQFKPGSREFAVDEAAPGFREIELFDDGSIETRVIRAEHIAFEVDYTSKGY
ncbi:3',5'-cyclic-AMP phosphodiesterase [Hahella sp. SMD15-11]|uniref:3',5'-cyclic-AMP phosphodiesterase n=1 Tax=Thermohahella caldifontis TaxID=3142973 RepID=A0AB39UVR9_9GAMM